MKPKTATISEFAKHRGVKQPAASKWKAKGLLVMAGKLVDVAASDAVLDGLEKGPPEGHDPRNRSEAQFLRETYVAKLRRQEYQMKEGKLIDRAENDRKLFAIHRELRDGLLLIPTRTAPMLATETDPEKIHALLTMEITELLNATAERVKRR
jgi:hypothetical protein